MKNKKKIFEGLRLKWKNNFHVKALKDLLLVSNQVT